jgi:hypothetical protein
MTNDFDANTNIEKRGSDHAGLGKVLASDGGIKTSDYFFQGLPMLITVVLVAWVLCFQIPASLQRTVTVTVPVSDDVSVPITVPETLGGASDANFVFWLGVVLIAVLVFVTVWLFSVVASSKITVYEKGIIGVSPGGMQFFRRNIQLSYDKISSVDSDWNSIRIIVPGMKYSIFVKNPAEIQRIIFEQQQKMRG